jgi:putative nucleotidyltransferase with HDIG domain
VEIPQQGDDHKLWKTEATRALPALARADSCGAGDSANQRFAHCVLTPTRGLTAEVTISPERVRFKAPEVEASLRFKRIRVRRPTPIELYGLVVFFAAVGMVAGLILNGYRLSSPAAVALLAVTALLAEAQSVRLTPTFELSVASLTFIFAAALFGPIAAVVVGASGLLIDLWRRDADQHLLRWTVWTSSRALVAGAAGVAATVAGGVAPATLGKLLAAVAAASAADVVGDLLLSPLPAVIRGNASWRQLTATLVPLQLSAIPLHVPVITLLAYAYVHISPWSVAFFVAPAFAAQRLFLLYRRQRETAEELAAANVQLEKASLSFATALVATLDARDRYTAGHSAAVAIYSRDIAARMGLSVEDQQLAHLCGLVHDIGKVGLAPGLLEKTGALTLEERRQMEEHPVIGERILGKVEDYAEIARIVRHHHERVDGHGYPDGLHGAEIPLIARIIAVADAYNAMTSDRPYRDAMPSRVARLRVAQAVESQFDTSVVAAFEAILAGAAEAYRDGAEADFAFEAQDTAPARPRLAHVAVVAV